MRCFAFIRRGLRAWSQRRIFFHMAPECLFVMIFNKKKKCGCAIYSFTLRCMFTLWSSTEMKPKFLHHVVTFGARFYTMETSVAPSHSVAPPLSPNPKSRVSPRLSITSDTLLIKYNNVLKSIQTWLFMCSPLKGRPVRQNSCDMEILINYW